MLINQLHDKFPELQDLRVRDILVDKDKRKIRCILSYPNNSSLDATTKSNIYAFVRSCVPKGYYCETKIYNDVFSEVSFRTNLFDYLKKREIPVVWTLHDCWAFTGHCAYFDYINCKKWEEKGNKEILFFVEYR